MKNELADDDNDDEDDHDDGLEGVPSVVEIATETDLKGVIEVAGMEILERELQQLIDSGEDIVIECPQPDDGPTGERQREISSGCEGERLERRVNVTGWWNGRDREMIFFFFGCIMIYSSSRFLKRR